MTIHDRVHGLIDEMIKINLDRRMQENNNSIGIDAGVIHYAANYCTVICDLGRRMGHTEYIRRKAKKGCLVVTPHKVVFGEAQFDIVSAIEVGEGVMIGKLPYQTIFVNEPSNVFKDITREDLYRQLARKGVEQTFILLGE